MKHKQFDILPLMRSYHPYKTDDELIQIATDRIEAGERSEDWGVLADDVLNNASNTLKACELYKVMGEEITEGIEPNKQTGFLPVTDQEWMRGMLIEHLKNEYYEIDSAEMNMETLGDIKMNVVMKPVEIGPSFVLKQAGCPDWVNSAPTVNIGTCLDTGEETETGTTQNYKPEGISSVRHSMLDLTKESVTEEEARRIISTNNNLINPVIMIDHNGHITEDGWKYANDALTMQETKKSFWDYWIHEIED